MCEKHLSFTDRVISYIKSNYDIPDKMEFYIGDSECDFKDWVDAYIEEFNGNVNVPFDDLSDESDVEAVGDEILQIMTSPYNPYSPNQWTINYGDFLENDDEED